MRSLFLVVFFAFIWFQIEAKAVYTIQDSLLYEKCIAELKPKNSLPINELFVQIALHFKGKPYASSTLEMDGKEQLVINLRQFDCTTFVETCMAIARDIKSENSSFEGFCHQLQSIRYRRGRIDGYSSRLHYVTDWIFDNERLNILTDKSKSLYSEESLKEINFMSTHIDAYKALKKNKIQQEKIRAIEVGLNKSKKYNFIKKINIGKVYSKINDGDIVLFSTSTRGLDYSHLGIIFHDKGRLTFIHPSTKYGKVIVEPLSLTNYCMKSKTCTGISVLKLNDLNYE